METPSPPPAGILIRCQGLRKCFRDISEGKEIEALQDLTLEVREREFLTILGPSGCGKSTLLNIIAGFEKPTAGEVMLDGRPIREPGADRGVVFQEYALFPWLTVLDNVCYGLREKGIPRRERIERARTYLKAVGLEDFERRYPHELSGGMKQRVSLIRVLANDPQILLMDEPFAALDAQTRKDLQRELIALWQETHKTILFITHNVEEAVYLGDRVVVMTARPGRVKRILEIPLERPRDETAPDFNLLRRDATRLVEEELKGWQAALLGGFGRTTP
ncbi:MAG: ABC transporter ATP-binding protein [Candidatus Tectomicrobia bacterium]|nr:ABC transporter ATP-binding protein [Candidatus Tectomicrobia bacterium]